MTVEGKSARPLARTIQCGASRQWPGFPGERFHLLAARGCRGGFDLLTAATRSSAARQNAEHPAWRLPFAARRASRASGGPFYGGPPALRAWRLSA
jgi:hypothetical protein